MISRKGVAGAVCLGSLVFGGICLSQEPTRETRPATVKGADPAKLELRVRELEKQVKALTQGLESLRKEVEPTATHPRHPKPLSTDAQ
jgi:hypothetical protein